MAKIIDRENGKTLVIPVDEDGSLYFPLLKQYFAGAVGLAYLGEDGEEEIAVSFDETMTKLLPPAGGWKKLFHVVRSSAPCLPIPVTQAQSNVPAYVPIEVNDLVLRLENYLFFEVLGDTRHCFTVISTHYAISFNHGHHQDWLSSPSENQTSVIIYNQEGQKFETKVVECDPEVDFVVVRSEVPLVSKPPVIGWPRKLERYILLGYPTSDVNCQALEGIFSSIERDEEGRIRGSSGSRRGYSGGPIFNYRGELLGINVANDSSAKFIGFNSQNTIGDLMNEVNATFPFLSIIVPAYCVAFRYHKDCKFKH
ncbi:hypothetical protein FO519_005543 [Halicephalobus sp. NKZ332]|nr:hypothetical protein FO519_005543 [Halicephalobus sp. NKZ332]